MSHSTTLALCYFNCCYFEEWCFSKFSQRCPRRMDELWIIYHLCGNTLAVWYGGLHSAVHLHSCYGSTLIGDWWRGIFHRRHTSSRTPSLGLPLSPVHGALDEYDWQRWSPPHAVTNYSSQWLTSWWINVYCVSRTESPLSNEMRDECVLIWSCAPCTTLIIIFIDEYHCRQDDEVAICVQRLSHTNTEQGLCHWREIWSCTDLRLLSFQLAHCTHARTHSLALSVHSSEYIKSVFLSMLWTKCTLQSILYPDLRYEQQPFSTHNPAFWDIFIFFVQMNQIINGFHYPGHTGF